MLDFTLSPEQETLRMKAREFALAEILPLAWACDERDETPLSVLKKAYDAGLMNTDIPTAYGGLGYGLIEGCLLTEELAAACPGIATSVFDNSLGMEPLVLSENEDLKKRVFQDVLNNFKMVCFATSEPTLGSDVSGIRCTATPDGADYVLNGTKYWVTNAGLADYMTVFASVDPEKGHEGIGAFLVEKTFPGVTVGRHIPKMGQRGSNTAGIHLKEVRVPAANVIAPPGEGFILAMKTFSRTRPTIGAFAVGAARSALDFAIDYAKKRRTFGTQIANYQAIQFKLAEMFQKVETSRLLVWRAAWDADQGVDPTVNASISKFYATEAAFEVVDEALQIFGGYGYTRMFPIEKLMRDMRLYRIYEGTSEIQRMIVSGHVLHGYQPVMPPLDELPMHTESIVDAGGQRAWRCRMCGHIHYGDAPPEACPYCFFPEKAFKEISAGVEKAADASG